MVGLFSLLQGGKRQFLIFNKSLELQQRKENYILNLCNSKGYTINTYIYYLPDLLPSRS